MDRTHLTNLLKWNIRVKPLFISKVENFKHSLRHSTVWRNNLSIPEDYQMAWKLWSYFFLPREYSNLLQISVVGDGNPANIYQITVSLRPLVRNSAKIVAHRGVIPVGSDKIRRNHYLLLSLQERPIKPN